MRMRILCNTAVVALCMAPSASLSQDEMEQQRCVWRCLADSTGNTDPAYDACVARNCVESPAPAPAGPAPAAPAPAAPAPAAPAPAAPAPAASAPAASAPAASAPVQSGVAPGGAAERMTVTVVQHALVDLGLYYGPVDGVYGGETAAAVETFRLSRGLGPGGVDGELVYRLRQESAAARQ
jgi:Putative peptidoglycan binding domain